MKLMIEKSHLRGIADIPGSKSHTIRAVAIAALAEGRSTIRRPLESADARSAFDAYGAFGAAIEESVDPAGAAEWKIDGTGGALRVPENVIDVANSGTTMRLALGSAALLEEGIAVLTGDAQVRSRPCGPLAEALNSLGGRVRATRGGVTPPYVVEGRLRGGDATLEAVTSQYVSSILVNAPLADGDTRLHVPLLNEKPYVGMTLDWLARQGVKVDYAEDYSEFGIPGGQRYTPVDRVIPADFSSATFFLAAGALGGNDVLCRGLDMSDCQGDKAVVEYLKTMGASVSEVEQGIHVQAADLHGCEIDLNATPDALPMLAVMGCFARGVTRLVNVPQARLKETDRIHMMRLELEKLGAKVQELPDGLVIHESALRGGVVDGHDDHRIVMALAVAGSALPGGLTILGSEAIDITFPSFVGVFQSLGGMARLVEQESEK